jgi:hypothetical protein
MSTQGKAWALAGFAGTNVMILEIFSPEKLKKIDAFDKNKSRHLLCG